MSFIYGRQMPLFASSPLTGEAIYRYEGKLNGIENAVVLISYPKDGFHDPKFLRAFISTDVSLALGRF